jgi:hypothetical protein
MKIAWIIQPNKQLFSSISIIFPVFINDFIDPVIAFIAHHFYLAPLGNERILIGRFPTTATGLCCHNTSPFYMLCGHSHKKEPTP